MSSLDASRPSLAWEVGDLTWAPFRHFRLLASMPASERDCS
jgi:hypothetical protein